MSILREPLGRFLSERLREALKRESGQAALHGRHPSLVVPSKLEAECYLIQLDLSVAVGAGPPGPSVERFIEIVRGHADLDTRTELHVFRRGETALTLWIQSGLGAVGSTMSEALMEFYDDHDPQLGPVLLGAVTPIEGLYVYSRAEQLYPKHLIDPTPEQTTLFHAMAEGRLQFVSLRSQLVRAAEVLRANKWQDWAPLQELPGFQRLHPMLTEMLPAFAVTALLDLPLPERAGYLVQLLQSVYKHELDELMRLTKTASWKMLDKAGRERLRQLVVLEYLINDEAELRGEEQIDIF